MLLRSPTPAARVRRRLLGATAIASLLIPQTAALAQTTLPTGGSIDRGSATITSGSDTVTVDQTSSRAVVSWDSYDVGPSGTVSYRHPDNRAATLNMIGGSDPSEIQGRIESIDKRNGGRGGTVILYNGNGIAIGPGAQIDVGSFVATTRPPNVDAFHDNDQLVLGDGGLDEAGITNAGTITVADQGLAALVAPRVENSGLIQARLGTVQLAAASSGEFVKADGSTATTVDFYGDGLVQFRIDGGSQASGDLITHASGDPAAPAEIDAQGGTVLMTAESAGGVVNNAINLNGVVRAAGTVAGEGQVALVGRGPLTGDGTIRIGENALVEAGDGTVWMESDGAITQEDGSAILTRDLAAQGTSVQLTSYDNYAERIAGRALAETVTFNTTSGRIEVEDLADFRFNQSNATGDAPEIAGFDSPVVNPIGDEDLAGIGLEFVVEELNAQGERLTTANPVVALLDGDDDGIASVDYAGGGDRVILTSIGNLPSGGGHVWRLRNPGDVSVSGTLAQYGGGPSRSLTLQPGTETFVVATRGTYRFIPTAGETLTKAANNRNLVSGGSDNVVDWAYLGGGHDFEAIGHAALPYGFVGLERAPTGYSGDDSSDYFVGRVGFGDESVDLRTLKSAEALPDGIEVEATGRNFVGLTFARDGWGVDGDRVAGGGSPDAQLQHNVRYPDGPDSETMTFISEATVSTGEGQVRRLFSPDGGSKGIERGMVTLVGTSDGIADAYTDTRIATVTVTAQDATRAEGQGNPDLEAMIAPDGVVGDDDRFRRDFRVSTADLTVTTPADTASPPGTYPVTPGGLGESDRFAIDYVDGTLTVTAAEEPPIVEPPVEPPQPPEEPGPQPQEPAASPPTTAAFQVADLIRVPERGRDPDTPGDAVYRTTRFENPFIADPLLRSYSLGAVIGGETAVASLEGITPAAGPDGTVTLPFGGELNDTTGQHAIRGDGAITAGSPVNLGGTATLADSGTAGLEAIEPASSGSLDTVEAAAPGDAQLCSADAFLTNWWLCQPTPPGQ